MNVNGKMDKTEKTIKAFCECGKSKWLSWRQIKNKWPRCKFCRKDMVIETR